MVRGACHFGRSHLTRVPGAMRAFDGIERLAWLIHARLDGRFDRRYGTDTTGMIPLAQLTVRDRAREDCIWYEPMSVLIFDTIVRALRLDCGRFTFIDIGSGKGRVLLLAARHGFGKIIGVEFAEELHVAALRNITLYDAHDPHPGRIEAVCADATQFPLPDGPLVLFFYSPFTGSVMRRMIDHIVASLAQTPREMVIIFYGGNAESIHMLRSTGLACEELCLPLDWSRFVQYRCFVLRSPCQQRA